MKANIQHEIEEFIRLKAPGLDLFVQENPAFSSTTLGLGLKIDLKRLIPDASPDEYIGEQVMDMLAEVQKATVTAIGLEEYVRSRELAVLERLQARIEAGFPAGDDPIEAIRQELGGNPST